MRSFVQLTAIGLLFGLTQVASAYDGAAAIQAAGTTDDAGLNKESGLSAGTVSRDPVLTVKHNSQLTKHSQGSVQTNTDTYKTTTEFVHVTTVYAYNLAGELVDMKVSEIRTPRS